MIYLDSCALVKLVRVEAESEALQAWLDERSGDRLVTSEIALTEVCRTIRRVNHDDQGGPVDDGALARDLQEAAEVLSAVEQMRVDRRILLAAGALPAPTVRTLDAIHLASALELVRAEVEFVTYDRRLAVAAGASGLAVISPGRTGLT